MYAAGSWAYTAPKSYEEILSFVYTQLARAWYQLSFKASTQYHKENNNNSPIEIKKTVCWQ